MKPQQKIPNGWTEHKLGEIGEAFIGLTYSPDDVVATGGTLVFRSSNVLDSKIDYSDQVRVNKKIQDKLITQEGDILICARNGSQSLIGKNAYIDKISAGNTFGAFMSVYRTKYSKYVHFLFQSIRYKKLITRDLGPTINQVTTGNLNTFKFIFPPQDEQSRIVQILETWDKYLENLDQKIKIKKNIKKGLMQKLLTGKLKVKGFANEWKTVSLADVCDFVNGFTFKSNTYSENGLYKVITIANVQDGSMNVKNISLIDKIPENISKQQILQKGDILISMTGNVGRICRVNEDKCLLNQRVGKIIPKKINNELLFFLLGDRRFLNKMVEIAQGGAQDNLSTKDILKYTFDIPISIDEQEIITKILITADKKVKTLERQRKFVAEQKKYLLNNLITGQIRLPEFIKN